MPTPAVTAPPSGPITEARFDAALSLAGMLGGLVFCAVVTGGIALGGSSLGTGGLVAVLASGVLLSAAVSLAVLSRRLGRPGQPVPMARMLRSVLLAVLGAAFVGGAAWFGASFALTLMPELSFDSNWVIGVAVLIVAWSGFSRVMRFLLSDSDLAGAA